MSAGEVLAEYLAGHGFALHAPHLVDIEVLSALRRLVSSGEATAERADEAIADLLDLPIERFPHDILVSRMALADEPVPLLTGDARLARAVAEHCDVPVLLAG